jgi:methionyl-tRNA formyltransferase
MSYFGMIKKEDGQLNLNEPLAVLERKVRAYSPWPGTSLLLEGWAAQVKVHKVAMQPGRAKIGTRKVIAGVPAVAAADGWLLLEELQPAGKKPMAGKAFLAGNKDWDTE